MNPRKRKKRAVYGMIAAVLVLLVVGGGYLVYAAMTAQDKKMNDFQIGQVETKLEEVFDDSIQEIPKDQAVEKQVTVTNTGTIKQFVRVMVLPEVRTSIVGDAANEQVLSLVLGKDLLLENPSTDWLDGGDGYFYYLKEIEPKQSTSKLFEAIKLSDQLSDQYHEATFVLSLKVEAINCAEFAYRDAWWQGTTPADQPLKAVDDALKTKVEN